MMDTVVGKLVEWRPELTGVRGARSSALAFADAWHGITGRAANLSTEERLYRLGTLRTPSGCDWLLRDSLLTMDRGQLVEWVELFFQETFSQRDEAAGGRFVDTANQVGDRFMLWDVDGTPNSMAMLRAPAANVSRIGPVFTPLTQRGHGYGSALTAAAADLAHRSGTAEVVLFADPGQPRIERDLSADRVRTRRRQRSDRLRHSRLTAWAHTWSRGRAQTAHNARRVRVQTLGRGPR